MCEKCGCTECAECKPEEKKEEKKKKYYKKKQAQA